MSEGLSLLLAAGFGIASLVCMIIILIDAFQDSVIRGLCALFCSFYLLWYAIFDFEHENKWLIVILALGGGSIAGGVLRLAH